MIYLRIQFSSQEMVHTEFAKVLHTYSEDELHKAFVVIGAKGYRFRRLPG